MKLSSIILSLLFCSFFVNGQQGVDSLEAKLSTAKGKERLKILSRLTEKLVRTHRQKAWKYFDEFERLYYEMKEPAEFQAKYWHDKGKKLGHDGDVEGSISAYKKAETAAAGSKDYPFLWNLYNGFGSTYQEHGNKEKALFYFLKSYKIAEDHLGEGSIVGSAMNLGVCYAEAGNLKEALNYFIITKNAYEKKGDGWGYGNILNNIGQVYSLSGKEDSAFFYYTKALGVWERISDQGGLAMTHYNLGELTLRSKDFDTAEAHFLKSLELSEQINEQYGVSMNLASLSSLYFDSGNKKKALDYLEKSIAFAKKNNQLKTLEENYNRMYRFYKNTGDYKNALVAHEEFFFWYDSLNNADKSKNLQELYSQFETEKKEKEIQKQKAELSAKNLEIAQERTRELMLWLGVGVLVLISVPILISLYQHKKKNRIITQKQQETDSQKKLLEEKNQAITSSLQYAQRIQNALLNGEELLKQMFPDYFLLYQPRDIVSGDFYWTGIVNSRNENGNEKINFLFAVCDSTGHGVPGAFMSLLNISFLNQAVNEKSLTDPAEVLNYVRKMLIAAMPDEDAQDGMDGAVMSFEFNVSEKKLARFNYASANSHVWIAREGKITELQFDRMPVGKGPNSLSSFTAHEFNLNGGDQVFAMSDGYADQFGGPKMKKYKYQSLKKVLEFNSTESCAVQKKRLLENFSNWKGEYEQIDDVCVAGIKIRHD